MEKVVLGDTQIWIHPKEGAEQVLVQRQKVLQQIADIAYEALLTEQRQETTKSNI